MTSASPSLVLPSASSMPGQVLRRWLVLLLIWQAAAPCCHVHADATLAPRHQSSVERLQLALHLHTRHNSAEQPCPCDHDWHTHFGMPEDAVCASHLNSLQLGSDWPVPSVTSLDLTSAGLSTSFVRATAAADLTAMPSGFHSQFAAALALPVRFCVARL